MSDDLQAVIAAPPKQRHAVLAMAQYCRDLDGTELKIVEVSDEGFQTPHPQNQFACRQGWSLRCAALAMNGSPFIWLEHDSPPLSAGWRKPITAEYRRLGKPFMLPEMPASKYDIASGIGVYPGETHWLVPVHFKKHGWDWWMMKHLAPLISTTPLIQHSYGNYTDHGHSATCDAHRFPRDSGMIRPEALIFHRDAHQDIIRLYRRAHSNGKNFFLHSGDLGDIVAALPAIRQEGGGTLVITHRENGQRESMRGTRYETIAPLLASQDYIHGVEYSDEPKGITHDFTAFRSFPPAPSMNLAEWQAAAMGIAGVDLSPWLVVEPDHRARGRVVIARSARYRNAQFPWLKFLTKYRDACFFVGLPAEHADFERVHRRTIEYTPTANLMETARLIAGSRLFIGNQSAPFWLAAGLGVPVIQESFPPEMNSVVVRPNARYFRSMNDFRKVMA